MRLRKRLLERRQPYVTLGVDRGSSDRWRANVTLTRGKGAAMHREEESLAVRTIRGCSLAARLHEAGSSCAPRPAPEGAST